MNYAVSGDIASAGSTGDYVTFNIKVKGYWSDSSITVYARRGYSSTDLSVWDTQITHSSGGRDTKEVASDAEASRYFAEALVAAADLAGDLMANVESIEANYQAYRAKLRAEFEAERVAEQAKKDADVPLGAAAAEDLIQRMVAGGISQVAVYARGVDRPRPLTCTIRAKAKLYFCGGVIAKKDAIAMLTDASPVSYTHLTLPTNREV